MSATNLASSFIDPNVELLLHTDRVDSMDKISGHENWSIEGEISSEEMDDFFLLLRALAWDFYVRRGLTIKQRWAMFSCPENEPVQLQVWSLIGVDNRRACSLLLGELESLLFFPAGCLQNGGLEAGLRRLEDWFRDGGFAHNRHPTTPREMTANEIREAPKRLFELSNILQLPPVVPKDRLDSVQVLIAVGFVFVGCYGSSYWPHQLVDSEVLQGREGGTRVRLKAAHLLRTLCELTDDFRQIPEAGTWSDFRQQRGREPVSYQGVVIWVPNGFLPFLTPG